MTGVDAGALVLSVGAAFTDVRTSRIPNTLTMSGALLGLVANAVWAEGAGALASLIGLVAGLAVFFPLFALGGLGGGDVKLMAAIGAWIGWRDTLTTALYAAVAGGVLAVAVAVAAGYLTTAVGNLVRLVRTWVTSGLRSEPSLTLEHGRGPRVAYALPILVGLTVTIWLG